MGENRGKGDPGRNVKDQQAPPLSRHHFALDKEVALKFVTYLVEKRIADLPETGRAFCEQAGIHPKLLYHNPHISEIAKLDLRAQGRPGGRGPPARASEWPRDAVIPITYHAVPDIA